MASSLRVNAIIPSSGTNVAIGTAGGTVTYAASVSGVSTFSSGIVVSAGSTSAPSISPSGDSNTGIFFPSADTVAFAEGGVEAARFDSNGRLGIGTQIPSAVINVRSSAAELARFTNTGSNGGDWEVKLGGGGFEDRKFMLTDKFGGTDNVRVSVDSSGRVTMPYQPFFYAKAGAARDDQTSNPTVFNNVVTNVGNHYDGTTNYRFTAPVAGVYLFTSQPGYKETSDDASWKLYKNGATFTDFVRVLGGLNSHSGWSCAALVYLNVNEYVHIGWDGSAGGYHQNADMSYFSGVLIG